MGYVRTRVIKEVDFGFSFGLSAFDDADPAESGALPQPPATVLDAPTIIPKPQNGSSQQSEYYSSNPPQHNELSRKEGLLSESKRNVLQYRSPASRSDASERPSLFDIPEDDDDEEPEPSFRAKRRKIGLSSLGCFLECPVDLQFQEKSRQLEEMPYNHLATRGMKGIGNPAMYNHLRMRTARKSHG